MRTKSFLIAVAAAASLSSLSAHAVNLVTNGDFEITTNGANKQLGSQTQVTGWSTTGYNFVFADIGATVTGNYGSLSLWGPSTGAGPNGAVNSPTGGNFVAADGAFEVAPITQTLSGLSAGQYLVSFDWAGAQQTRFNGPNTEQWEVSLGNGPSQFTAVYNNPSHGFGGWWHESFIFTVGAGDSVLSFLAHGTPDGVPPFSLLDGVSVQAIPEPETWALMLGGLAAVGLMISRRKAVAA